MRPNRHDGYKMGWRCPSPEHSYGGEARIATRSTGDDEAVVTGVVADGARWLIGQKTAMTGQKCHQTRWSHQRRLRWCQSMGMVSKYLPQHKQAVWGKDLLCSVGD